MDKWKITQRLKRSINEKDMKVIEMNYHDNDNEKMLKYVVLGNSGKFYNVKIPLNDNIHCECIDHRNTRSFCKHIYLIYVKILKIIPDLDNISLFVNDEIFNNLIIKHNEFINKKNNDNKDIKIDIRNKQDDCSICFISLDECKEIYACYECKNGFHMLCIDQMIKFHNKCPLCRSIIKKDLENENKDIINLIKKIENI